MIKNVKRIQFDSLSSLVSLGGPGKLNITNWASLDLLTMTSFNFTAVCILLTLSSSLRNQTHFKQKCIYLRNKYMGIYFDIYGFKVEEDESDVSFGSESFNTPGFSPLLPVRFSSTAVSAYVLNKIKYFTEKFCKSHGYFSLRVSTFLPRFPHWFLLGSAL